jgi:hypothetical protein
MVGIRDEHRRHAVKGQLSVWFQVRDRLIVCRRLHAGMVGIVTAQGPRRLAAKYDLVDAGHD